MTASKKAAIFALAIGTALASAPAVANAQSSSLFGNLSSSNVAPAPVKPSYEESRGEFKRVILEKEEVAGSPITDEGNGLAQRFADEIVSGIPVNEARETAYEMGASLYVSSIPNVLLESRIDSFVRLEESLLPYFASMSGIGVAGNDTTTYVVGLEWRP